MTGGKAKFLALAALFFVPLFIAAIWFVQVQDRTPADSAAHGDLVHPPRPLGAFEFERADAAGMLTDGTLHGRWAIVHVGPAACDEECRARLWASRQVHTRLGREGLRVQRVYLLVDAEVLDDPAFFEREHDGMAVGRVSGAHRIVDLFRVDDRPPAAGRTYIVDPLGNLMMSYPPDASPGDLYQDLKRLLRLSRIG